MFKVLKNGRVATKTRFTTYEQARQYVRKLIRKNTDRSDFWRVFSTNPPIGDYGYSITQA